MVSSESSGELITMPDDTNKSPPDPRIAALLSFMRMIGFAIAFVGSIWTFIATKDLAGLYAWAHSSVAVMGLSAVATLALGAWGPLKRYIDARTIKRQDTAIKVATETAPPHVL